jgi:hypothetical protein
MGDENMSDNKQGTGIDRRSALECMIWAGTGIIWTLSGGVPKSSQLLGIGTAQAAEKAVTGFRFLQISDSHVGFRSGPFIRNGGGARRIRPRRSPC